MKADTQAFRDKFEKLLSKDYVMLDNVSEVAWREGDPGYFLVVVSPKSDEVFDSIKEHAVKAIREMRLELNFKAQAQELVINGVRSAVFKVIPQKT
jgi:hypothetical protein